MSEDRTDLMLEILKRMQGDLGAVRRDVASQAVRLSALEDFVRGVVTSQFGMQADLAAINHRLDRIERRLELTDDLSDA